MNLKADDEDDDNAYKMSPKTQLRKTISNKFKQFCKHCTLHGVYYFHDSTRWWVHAIWLVILSSCLVLCCYLSHMIWNKFAVDPTLTVVETTHYSTADIRFPAVTICDTEVVYSPSTANITTLLSLRGYNKTQIMDFFQSFAEMKLKDYTPKPYVLKMHRLLEHLGYPFLTLLFMFKKPCEQLLKDCTWRSQPQDCRVMFRPVYTMMGYCCVFDITYFREHVDKLTNFIGGMQPTEALDVVVDGQRVSSDGDYSNGYISLYVSDENDRVTFVNNAILITPGAYFDINVYLWAIDSSSYVKALSLHKRECILDTDPSARSYQGCLSSHVLRKVVDQCNCLPFDYTVDISAHGLSEVWAELTKELFFLTNFIFLLRPLGVQFREFLSFLLGLVVDYQSVGNARAIAEDLDVDVTTICTWDRLLCIYQSLEKVQTDIRIIMAQNACYQKCDYVQYETEAEFIKNNRIIKGLESRSRVLVHYSASTCMKYRREVLYTWDQMLANLGGIFGLCLGGSLISIIEIIWFIVDLIFTVIKDRMERMKIEARGKKKIASKKWVNRVYTISREDLKEGESAGAPIKFTN